MAALVRTTPRRDSVKPLVPSTVKVVPKLVEQREAPAAKHWIGVAGVSRRRINDSAIGTPIPVSATASESHILALRDFNEVDNPPVMC
jgi:hypothetical protein